MEKPESLGQNNGEWERALVEKLLLSTVAEQRSKRRWRIFFRLLFLFVFLVVFVSLVDLESGGHDGEHVAVVSIGGIITADSQASAEKVNQALQEAFEESQAKGVVLRINSPGGSPVQSDLIWQEIRRLRKKYPQKPLYAVAEDVCASGAYYVASAADRIYVNPSSIVGSIGVIMEGFGAVETLNKIGLERRLVIAGENKAFMDMFSPLLPQHKEHANALLANVHENFIKAVREGRGARLHETPEIFSGLMWTGTQSVPMGLSDGFGSVDSVAREQLKLDKLVEYSVEENFAENVVRRLGTQLAMSWRVFMQTAASETALPRLQ